MTPKVVDDAEGLETFWRTTTPEGAGGGGWMDGMSKAPVVIVPLSHRDAYLDRYAEPDKGWTDKDEARWPVPYWDIDTAFATMALLLGATDAGLGALFFGIFGGLPELRAVFGEHAGGTALR